MAGVQSSKDFVFDFPIHLPGARPVAQVPAWEQGAVAEMLQREWADNAVSCTISFNPKTEGHQIANLLGCFGPVLKSISLLPHSDHGVYPQMPYEGITREDYEVRLKKLKAINWEAMRNMDGEMPRYCTDEFCEP